MPTRKNNTGIMALPEVKQVLSTRDRDVMLDGLKHIDYKPPRPKPEPEDEA